METWLILISVILLICIAEWMREIRTFRITHYDVTSEKLNGLEKERKVLFLTDLHNNCYGRQNEKLIGAVREQHPDLILIGGDMLVGLKGAPTKVAEGFVREIAKICPIYYANGNHEFRLKIDPEIYGETYARYKSTLEGLGVHFLENAHADLLWDECSVQIHGLEIPRECYKKFGKRELTPEEVAERIGAADPSKYQILLVHNPMYMNIYQNWGADLILSGHLHGGVVRIPGLGGVITPQFRMFPKHSGELTVDGDTSIVVSKGLGTHTIKIRFLNPAEIVVLHIKGKEK